MNILNKILPSRRRKRKQDAHAMKDFIQNYHHGEMLSQSQARENVEKGLVEIVWPSGQHAGNGLLITDNGYFLTCSHCLENGLENSMIRDYTGSTYLINGWKANGRTSDIALAKANISDKPPQIMKYKFYDRLNIMAHDRTIGIPLMHLSRRDGEIVRKYGSLSGEVHKTAALKYESKPSMALNNNGLFLARIPDSVGGDSGGVIIDPMANIIGLMTGGAGDISTNVRLTKALEMIHHYVTYLGK